MKCCLQHNVRSMQYDKLIMWFDITMKCVPEMASNHNITNEVLTLLNGIFFSTNTYNSWKAIEITCFWPDITDVVMEKTDLTFLIDMKLYIYQQLGLGNDGHYWSFASWRNRIFFSSACLYHPSFIDGYIVTPWHNHTW